MLEGGVRGVHDPVMVSGERNLLGVQDFGQSGDLGDLYRHFGIETDTIVGAAADLIAP